MSNRRKLHQPPPATTAIVFTCAACWEEWFPGKEPPGYSRGGARMVAIHAEHAAEFIAHGFEVVPGAAHGPDALGVFCPHLVAEALSAEEDR